jgi:phosphoribosylformylglycinamidine synthase
LFNQFNLNNCTDWWLPIRHGEGRIVVKDEMIQKKINDQQLGVLTYLENVNGSYQQIAGLCNLTGNVLGLMPHPEAGAYPAQLPFPGLQARGLWLFESALSYLKSEM